MNPNSGAILALAGIAFSGLQPPGSTFKVITTTAALEAGKVKLSDSFPYASYALVGGVPLHNANNEVCGGTFVQAFAESCNSVFAPLGAKVGAAKLVETAERYGFNRPTGIDGAPMSTLPAASEHSEYPDDLAVGATAIGQGKVLASTLEMVTVAATIAEGGSRPLPTLVSGATPRFEKVTSPAIARTIRKLMIEVVRGGTGTAAAVPGIQVAGKTGTAELGNGVGGEQIPGDTDGWFICFAPARHPKIAVAVLMIRAGAGGQVAAPVAQTILSAVLKG
jgi:cell division protein FtsI/penicillin-binding protein 2